MIAAVCLMIHCQKTNITTVMCLSIGTTKIINFPFVPNGKLIILRCQKIFCILQPNYDVLKYWST